MAAPRLARLALLAAIALAAGCETLVGDAATRIRHQLRDAAAELEASQAASRVVTVEPRRWPDGCAGGAGYRVRLVPYRGGKQVAAADVFVQCRGGIEYSTGTRLAVPREMAVDKAPGEALRITLRKAAGGGVEVAALD